MASFGHRLIEAPEGHIDPCRLSKNFYHIWLFLEYKRGMQHPSLYGHSHTNKTSKKLSYSCDLVIFIAIGNHRRVDGLVIELL